MPHITEVDVSVLKGHVISARYTGIETESLLYVFACYFPISMVH